MFNDAMTNDARITCPKCGAEIPLTEAVAHRVCEQLAADFEKQRQELTAALAAREQKHCGARSAAGDRSLATAPGCRRGVSEPVASGSDFSP